MIIIGDLTPTGYSFYHSPRQTRGGGVGILIKDGFDISRSTISSHQFQKLKPPCPEVLASSLFIDLLCHQIVIAPPIIFMVEFRSLLEQYVTDSSSLLITGDFNLHVDNNLDKSSQDFLALIDSFNFKQHICSLTQRAGHILDLLITRDHDQLVTSVFLFMTLLSLTILLLIVLCPLRNLCSTSFPGSLCYPSRDPGWVWSRGPRTKLIPREESFVSQFFCLVRFHRSRNDRKGKADLLSLQL